MGDSSRYKDVPLTPDLEFLATNKLGQTVNVRGVSIQSEAISEQAALDLEDLNSKAQNLNLDGTLGSNYVTHEDGTVEQALIRDREDIDVLANKAEYLNEDGEFTDSTKLIRGESGIDVESSINTLELKTSRIVTSSEEDYGKMLSSDIIDGDSNVSDELTSLDQRLDIVEIDVDDALTSVNYIEETLQDVSRVDGVTIIAGDVKIPDGVILSESSNIRLEYDSDNQTLKYNVPDGGSIQVNQEPHDYYHNLEGTQIINGDIVSICGATGNRTAVCLTDTTNDAKALGCVGMVTVPTIGNDNDNVGRITKSGGKVRELNTNAYNEGDILYVHPTNKGKWTATKPTTGRVIRIGVVSVKHATEGVVELDIEIYPKVNELSNVQTELTAFKFGDGTTNYSQFNANGNLIRYGTATVFDDLTADITRVKTVGTRVTINDTESSIEFTTACVPTTDYALVSYQIPHGWKLGSTIFPHIHWEQVASNNPNWVIQYRWQKQGDAKTTSWTNYKVSTNAFTYVSGALNQITHDSGLTAPVGYGISDIIQMRVTRDTTNSLNLYAGADPYIATASVTAIDIHIEKDTDGSETEYTK